MNALPPLRQRVIGASIWSLGGFGFSQLIRFGGNLLMTRLLTPDLFGIMAVATVVMSTVAVLSDLGLKQNVVQSRRGSEPDFLNTVWTVQIVRASQLALAILGVAGLILVTQHYKIISSNSVYADGRVPLVVAAVSLAMIISGFASTKIFEASRHLRIQRVVLIEILAQAFALASMLLWIKVHPSIWALVGGAFASTIATVVLSHAMLPGLRNRLRWDKSVVREVIQFGKWILLSSMIGALIANLDRLLLAGMTDAATLGVYAIAYNMYLATEQLLMRAVAGIGYAAISEVVRDRPSNLKFAYYKLHTVVALAAYFGFGALSILAPRLITLLYDSRYSDAGWMLQILSGGLLLIPSQLALQTFLALNKPRLNTAINLLRLVAILVAMPAGFAAFGLPGALMGLVLASLICIFAVAFLSIRHRFFDWRRELIPLPAIALGLLAGKMALLCLGSP
ncbi:oligosaccharide flippase family protein [Bradyrhizobium symbiodeficiens]|uniref:oligosaccharide flippase family protein n=1 Tax=Bradyrhizobium symbiodeficiens TaxID=1404367 RepID=UPI0030D59850